MIALVAVAVSVETAIRCLLVSRSFALAVLAPPLFVGVLLGAAAPAVRTVADGEAGVGWDEDLLVTLRERGPALAATTIVGHPVAVAGGLALFLLVDTPLRYAYYALGGGPIDPLAMLVLPLTGVGVATALVWTALLPTLAAVADGVSVRVATRHAVADLAGAIRRPRLVGGAVLAVAVAVPFAVVPLFVLAGAVPYGTGPNSAVVATVALTGAALTVSAWFAYPTVVGLTGPLDERSPLAGDVWGPAAGKAVLACLLVGSLVAGAAAVRVTETRPTDHAAREPLPDDPTAAYRTALDNTGSGSYVLNTTVRRPSDEEASRSASWLRVAVDRDDRRMLVTGNWIISPRRVGGFYYTMGVITSSSSAAGSDIGQPRASVLARHSGTDGLTFAFPAYPYQRPQTDDLGRTDDTSFSLPSPNTGEWTVVDRGEGTMTVALTDPEAVSRAMFGDFYEDESVVAGTARIRIDTDRGVITGGRYRAVWTDGETRYEEVRTYDVTTGDAVDVERPWWAGSPGPGELLWKTLAY